VTDRQLRPTLIGFNNAFEKRFFEVHLGGGHWTAKAARALAMSVSTIARAIESEDIGLLRQLPGIGERTARKMVATLRGKVTEEALLQDAGFASMPALNDAPGPSSQLREDVLQILVDLGHRSSEAQAKVDAALKRRPISTLPRAAS
jgi:Holliday junction DNA helicase RuvA